MSLAISPASLPLLPSFRRQQLLLEFASLKYHCPDGIYLTPNPSDPTCWTGVYFVREGPYNSAILRFELLFPPSYPQAPPLVIFSTEIFHPLLVPITTYTFSSGAEDPFAAYSAPEIERLPPGALSLRYGFPHWFSTPERGRTSMRTTSETNDEGPSNQQNGSAELENRLDRAASDTSPHKTKSITIKLLDYIKSVFEDPVILDELPFEATGNPNAWHAWRSYRELPKQRHRSESPEPQSTTGAGISSKNPADWNWEGVWEARVRDGVKESSSDALLFSSRIVRGGPSITDPIRFAKLDEDKLAGAQEDMLRMHGFY